jgi:hypothetical protein
MIGGLRMSVVQDIRSSARVIVGRHVSNDAVVKSEVVATSRDASIDMVRGWCIVMMVVAHVSAFSMLNHVTHVVRFTSGAGGFITLSGLTLGMIHRRRISKHGELGASALILRRAGLIWLIHCAIIAIGLALIAAFGDYFVRPWHPSPSLFVNLWHTATLQFQPTNILPMYVVLLVAASVMLPLMMRGWAVVCLAVAGGLYAWQQVSPWTHGMPVGIYEDDFNILSRLFVFTAAMAIGLFQDRLRQSLSDKAKRNIWIVTLTVFAIGFILAQIERPAFHIDLLKDNLEYALFGRPHLGVGRLLYGSAVVAVAIVCMRSLLKAGIRFRFMDWLEVFGKNALYCFILQSFLLFLPSAMFAHKWPLLVQDAFTIVVLVVIYHMAKFKVLRNIIPN